MISLHRECKKNHILLASYITSFFLLLVLLPYLWSAHNNFNFETIIIGEINNQLELTWWIFLFLLPTIAITNYWNKELKDFFVLEYLRIRSIKRWLITKITFIVCLQLLVFLGFGLFVYFSHNVNISMVFQVIHIGFYIIAINLLILLMSLFISSISNIILILVIGYLASVVVVINKQTNMWIASDGNLMNLFILLAIIAGEISLLLSVSKPHHFTLRRRERN